MYIIEVIFVVALTFLFLMKAQSSDDEGLLREEESVLKLRMQKAKSYTNEDSGHDVNEDWSDLSDMELTVEVRVQYSLLVNEKGSTKISKLILWSLFSSLGYPLLCFFDK